MTRIRERPASSSGRALPAILTAGFVAGVFDISSAFILAGMKGRTPGWILRYVASGLLGARSFEGGHGTVMLGAVLHFTVAVGAAAVFYLASRQLTFLTKRPVVSGIVFGIAVYAFMNLIVLPLSLAKVRPTFSGTIIQLLIHMFLIGLPISLIVRRIASSKLSHS